MSQSLVRAGSWAALPSGTNNISAHEMRSDRAVRDVGNLPKVMEQSKIDKSRSLSIMTHPVLKAVGTEPHFRTMHNKAAMHLKLPSDVSRSYPGFISPSQLMNDSAIDAALIAAGPDLMAQMIDFDLQYPNLLDDWVYHPRHSDGGPLNANAVHDTIEQDGPIFAKNEEVKMEPPNDDTIFFNAEVVDVPAIMDDAGRHSPHMTLPHLTQSSAAVPEKPVNRASQRAARSKYWPRRSDPTPVYDRFPQQFQAYDLGGADGQHGEDSGRNLFAFYGLDPAPRTRFAIRIIRGRTDRDQRLLRDLRQYPPPIMVIPGGTSLKEMCLYWPRHVWGSGLRMFMAEGWAAERIWRSLPPGMRLAGNIDRPWNYIQKAMERETERICMEDGKTLMAPKKRNAKQETGGIDGDSDISPTRKGYGNIRQELLGHDQGLYCDQPIGTLPSKPDANTIPPLTKTMRDPRSFVTQELVLLQDNREELLNVIQQEQTHGLDLEWRLGRMVDRRYVGCGTADQQWMAYNKMRGRLHRHRDQLRAQYQLGHISVDREMDLYRAIHQIHNNVSGSVEGHPEHPGLRQRKEEIIVFRSLLREQSDLNQYLRARLEQSLGRHL